MKFSLIHPSRSRPEKSADTILKWRSRAVSRFQLIVSVDEDDDYVAYSQMHHLPVYSQNLHGQDRLLISRNKSTVEAINKGALIADGDILIVVSDDTDCPEHWDKILTDAIGQSRDFVMKTDDGIQKRIITMPIMDRAYFNRDGYIYNPIYTHSWCDTELTEVAHLRKRVITRMDIKFPHNHYSVIGEKPDELYQRNDLTHDRDRPIYQKRKLINFGL